MKILLGVHLFLPEYSAGTEILTFNTAKELQRLGHEVFVFTGHPAKQDMADADRFDSYVYEGIRVERFHHAYVPMGGDDNIVAAEYNHRFFASHFRKYLQQLQPDLVHFFHLQYMSASAIDVCEELDIPVVLTPTDFWLVCPMNQLRMPDNSPCLGPDRSMGNCLRHVVAGSQPPVVKHFFSALPDWLLVHLIGVAKGRLFARLRLARFVAALAERPAFLRQRMNKLARVLVPTRLMSEILIDNGLQPEKVRYCPFGIKIADITRETRQHSLTLRLGFIGKLSDHKGCHVLLRAVAALPDQQIQLQIYGDVNDFPDYVASLRRIAGDDRRISFCGTFPNTKIGEVLSGMDVLVVPSVWYENTPLVIHSAQAAGCPVVASNLGGMSETITDGHNGLLFKAGDVAELTNAIQRLISEKNLLRHLSEHARSPKPIGEYVQELLATYAEVMPEKTR